MLPGPVFAVELMTTARRARYYALRCLYGMVLLLIFWISYSAFAQTTGFGRQTYTPGELSMFARSTFIWFAVAQGVTVLVITPALVGGTVAGEKQRKTLHYLLASQLSSGEIVLGKLLARMLMIFVFLVATVPLLFLLRFFGGVEIELILVTFGSTATFAFFLASVSIFFSTVMRQARSAITMTYLSMIAILVSPLFADYAAWLYPVRLAWLPDAIGYINPLIDFRHVGNLVMRGWLVPVSLWRMLLLQWAFAVLLLIYSTRSLRRIAANDRSKPKTVLRLDNRGRASWRAIPRKAVGDDPMMWKEYYTSRVGGVAKMLGLLNNLFWAVLIGCLTFEFAWTALKDIIQYGFYRTIDSPNRLEFNALLRALTPWLASFWLLGTTTSAASSIASEREDDTWISLVATDLEGDEILRAKLFGSILRFRWIGLTLITIWVIGTVGGAIHPLGLLSAIVEMAVFLWFAAILGLRFSLLSSSTSKALALSLGWLVFLNVGYLLCCVPLPGPLSGASISMFGMMPAVVRWGIFSANDMQHFERFLDSALSNDVRYWFDQPAFASAIGVLYYGIAAAILTRRTFRRFDAVVDRPKFDFDAIEAPASANWARTSSGG